MYWIYFFSAEQTEQNDMLVAYLKKKEKQKMHILSEERKVKQTAVIPDGFLLFFLR